MQVPSAPAIEGKIDFKTGIVPADGTEAANWTQRRHRYVAVFGQLFGQVAACPHLCMWGARTKAQWRVEKLIRG
jgi:hypothetical protein